MLGSKERVAAMIAHLKTRLAEPPKRTLSDEGVAQALN